MTRDRDITVLTTAVRLAAAGASAVALVVAAVPAAAAPAQRLSISQQEISTSSFPAGAGPCVPWAGTIDEDRLFTASITFHPTADAGGGGAAAGQGNVDFRVDATFTLTPADPADGPSITGTYTEHGAGRIDVVTDTELVTSYVLVTSATAADGTPLRFLDRGHLTVGPHGQVLSDNHHLTCART